MINRLVLDDKATFKSLVFKQAHKEAKETKSIFTDALYSVELSHNLKKLFKKDRTMFIKGDRVVFNGFYFAEKGHAVNYGLYEVLEVNNFGCSATIVSTFNNMIYKVNTSEITFSAGVELDIMLFVDKLLRHNGIDLDVLTMHYNDVITFKSGMPKSVAGWFGDVEKCSRGIEINSDYVFKVLHFENSTDVTYSGITKLVDVVIHELGHLIHLNFFNYETLRLPSENKSDYACKNKYENFAEAFMECMRGNRPTEKRDRAIRAHLSKVFEDIRGQF